MMPDILSHLDDSVAEKVKILLVTLEEIHRKTL
jgi:hypothetical protein